MPTDEPEPAILDTAVAPPPPTPPPTTGGTVASVWHTLLLLAYLAAITWMSASSVAEIAGPAHDVNPRVHALPRPVIYATVLASEWLLFAITYVGLRLRGVSIASLVSYRWRGWSGLGRCLFIAAVCWVGTFVGVVQGLDALGFRSAADVQRVADLVLPRGPMEIALWLIVSVTAGFVEELVFRGYLQRQFGAWCRNAYVGIVFSAVVFGAGHLYQGIGAAAIIAVVGLCFSVTAYVVRSIAPGIVAHAFEDFFSGLIGRA